MCERDARQSGGFGTGIVGAIEMQSFFNRCMVARGWTQQDREVVAAQMATQQVTGQQIVADRRACVQEVRDRPEFASLQRRHPDIQTGRFTLQQMADSSTPTVQEAALYLRLATDVRTCRETGMARLREIVPPQTLRPLQDSANQIDQTVAQLVRRQMSWGDFSSRGNQIEEQFRAATENRR